MARCHSVSGGAGSWLSAKVDMVAHPDAEHRFLFADTLYEDADCYRFLIEGVAYLVGRNVSNILPRAEDFPDYRVAGDFDIATYSGNPEWRAFLAQLREDATEAIPELAWLVEGRDPWEIFRDKRFLGNSRVDPCSMLAKREIIDAWRDVVADKERDVICVGIGPDEAHRYTRLAARHAANGWRYEAPLIDSEAGQFGAFGYLADAGIERPRLYRMNYIHNNCGGFCIKAGHAHYQNRLRMQPERYAYDEMMERKLGEYLGKDISILSSRIGGDTKQPMTLVEFRKRNEAQPEMKFEYDTGSSGCGCAVDYEEAA